VKKTQETKRREAENRNSAWQNKTPDEQLAHLDRLKLRAKKQRSKITKLTKKSP
jgi:hypothetical protein